MSAFTTQRVVIEFPERTSDCPKTSFQQLFPPKTHCNTMTRGRGEKFIWPHTDLVLSYRIGELFFDL